MHRSHRYRPRPHYGLRMWLIVMAIFLAFFLPPILLGALAFPPPPDDSSATESQTLSIGSEWVTVEETGDEVSLSHAFTGRSYRPLSAIGVEGSNE